jgi:hypothetical protein
MDIPAWAAPRASAVNVTGSHILFRRDYKFTEGLIAKGKFTNEDCSTEFEPLEGNVVILVDIVKGCAIRLG